MEKFESATGVLNADAGEKLNLNLFYTGYLLKVTFLMLRAG